MVDVTEPVGYWVNQSRALATSIRRDAKTTVQRVAGGAGKHAPAGHVINAGQRDNILDRRPAFPVTRAVMISHTSTDFFEIKIARNII